MLGVHLKSITLILLSSVVFIWCFKLIPEQAKVTYINKKYLDFGTLNVKRYSRKSPYYLNLEGRSKQTWSNNISLHFIFFEFLHNEYRRSFLEMHYKLCDLMTSDPYIGGMLKQKGLPCPIPTGEYHIMNITMPTENFPNVFPFEKGRVEGEITLTETGEVVGKGYVNALFKDTRKPPKLEKGK